VLLAHKYPKVRRVASEQLYVKLVTDDRILPEETSEKAQDLLTSTKWYEGD